MNGGPYDQDAETFPPGTRIQTGATGWPRGDFWVNIDGDGPYLARRSIGGSLLIKRRMWPVERWAQSILFHLRRHWLSYAATAVGSGVGFWLGSVV